MKQIKSNFIFFLVGAIIILCAGFIIISCGNDPQQKVLALDAGEFAFDVSRAAPGSEKCGGCGVYILDPKLSTKADINNKEFTVDAWVKRKTSGLLNGGIFSRFSVSGGLSSYVNNNQPKFSVKVGSVYYNVSANVDLSENEWTHVAGVFVNEDHSSVHGVCQSGESSSTSIKIDSSKNPHVAYYHNGHLKYATKTSGAWVTTVLDSRNDNIDVGSYPSLSLDSDNKAYISFYDVSNKDLKYATNASGLWAVSSLDSSGDVGQYTSIAVEPSKRAGETNNRVYISYYNAAGILKYVKNVFSVTTTEWTWDAKDVDDTPAVDVGRYTAITLDSTTPYISYYDATNGDLKYANRTSDDPDTWVKTTADSSGNVGQYTSIALESITEGTPPQSGTKVHITYYDVSGILKYFNFKPALYTPAVTDIVEVDKGSGVDVGKYASMVKDSLSNIYISYYDATNKDLKYATNAGVTSGAGNCYAGSDFNCTIVDSAEDIGKFTSIALDADDKVYISYYDATNSAFKFATNASGSWVTETIEANGRSTKPHIDIYVDGVYKNCASTDSQFITTDDSKDIYIGMIPQTEGVSTADPKPSGFDGLYHDTKLNAEIDEVRFWTVARTQAQLEACMSTKLDVLSAEPCNVDTDNLKGYWRFNEGTGPAANDISGYGFTGSMFNPWDVDWSDAWVSDSPF